MASGTIQEQPTHNRRTHDDAVVRAAGLTKIFKDFWLRDRARAVDNIDFQIHRGEIFGLLGPNGSGKSTTIKMILGLLKRTRGRISVFGKPPSDVSIKKRIGYVPEDSHLYPFLNARETLDYYGKLFHLSAKVRERRIDELLEMVGLSGVQYRQIREYSKGMQRRIGIAQALINDPEFLILDEPTTGLDPIGTRQIKDLILHLGERGKTILLSSHLLSDVEDVVDRMVILYGGRIRAEGTCHELLTSTTKSIIETDRLDEETINAVRELITHRRHTVEKISQPRQRLEELFLTIVERAQREQLATSGAASGGATASFLTGEGESQAAQGEALIDSLTRETQAPAPAPDEAPMPTEEPAHDESSAVIEELISRDEQSEPEPEISQTRKTEQHTETPEIDESVIGSLLDRNETDNTGESHKRGEDT